MFINRKGRDLTNNKLFSVGKSLLFDEKKYLRAKKKLLSLKEEELNRLIEKHSSNPEKLDEHLGKFVNKVTDNIKTFSHETVNIFKELDAIAETIEIKEFDEVKKIEFILKEWTKTDKNSIFPKESIEKLEKTFSKFRKEIRRLSSDSRQDDALIEHKRRPRTSLFLRVKSLKRLSKKEMKQTRKDNKERARIEYIFRELQEQIKNGIGPSFPYLFSELIEKEGKEELLIHHIKKEIYQIVQDLDSDLNEVVKQSFLVARHISNSRHFRNKIEEMKNEEKEEIKEVGKLTFKLIGTDYKDELLVFKEMEHDEDIFKFIIRKLNENNEKTRKEIEETDYQWERKGLT